MKVKIFYPNKDGRISFTKQELEKLLDDVYNEGHKDGYDKGYNARPYWYWTSPYYTTVTNSTPLTYTGHEPQHDYTVITCDAHNDLECATTTKTSSNATEATLNINLNDYINKIKSDSNTACINFTV